MGILDTEALERRHLLETSNDAAARAWSLASEIGAGTDVGEAAGDLAQAIVAALNGVRVATLALEAAVYAATAPPAVDVQPLEVSPALAGWAYVELMGRRVLVGYVQEVEIAHRTMLRIQRLVRVDRPRGVGEPDPPLELESKERFYSPSTLYSIEWIAEEEARDRWRGLNGSVLYDNDDVAF